MIHLMSTQVAVMLAAFFLAGACSTATAEPREKTLADVSPEPSAEMPAPDARAHDILSLLAAHYPDWPAGAEGNQTIDIKIAKNAAGAYQATIVQTGLLDDSVAQIKDTLIFGRDKNWFVASKQQHRKCYRTSMFEWTAKPCP